MVDHVPHELARLIEIEIGDGTSQTRPKPNGNELQVQFNPETLRVSRSNTVDAKAPAGTAGLQYVTTTSTRLDLELWFDVSARQGPEKLQDLTSGVYYFLTPSAEASHKLRVPGVRFHWGQFLFDGVLTSLNETLELFSNDGRPLRSRMALSFTSQEIRFPLLRNGDDAIARTGQTPQAPVRDGESVQQAMARMGRPEDWRTAAHANGIENPRQPAAGTLLGQSRATGGR